MIQKMRRFYIAGLFVLLYAAACAQEKAYPAADHADSTVRRPVFTAPEAWLYVDDAIRDNKLWRAGSDTIREAMQRLLEQVEEPYDTAVQRLLSYDLSKVPVHTGIPVQTGSTLLRWIDDSTFVVDPQGWNRDLYIKKEPKLVYPVDLSTLVLSDTLLDENGMLDPTLFTPDTVMVNVVDTTALKSLGISLHHISGGVVTPPLAVPDGSQSALLSEDRSRVLYFVPGTTWQAGAGTPFRILNSKHHLDSLQLAITALLDFTEQRDSTMLMIDDMYGRKTPMWLTTGTDEAFRFWVKNYNNDSITLWVGNPAPGEISLLLEDDVNFSRLMKDEIQHLPSFIVEPKRNLFQMELLEPKPIYWDYEFSSVLTVSQTYLANWTKGGESSFATMMDLMGRATYNNKDAKTQWINIARLKFGTISTQEKGFRKNHDEFEIDSRFNRNAWGKIGMSASFYMKHQLAKGYDYPNDSVVVSKFLNPGTMTLGLGAEYKPLEKTTINIAPLSYKTTYVLDTAHIDQTLHGIDPDKRAKREFGAQLVINNTISPLQGLEITNRARFFSSYLNKPQNVDVDWEMVVEKKIAWFFTVRLDFHLIYDNDILFKVYDDNGEPIQLPNGSNKEVPRVQLKEFLGLALSFKF
jgi:hypothetical protein